jgi:hypothetical protein
VQAGQLLNLAAAGVLPRLTRPTAEYSGIEIASWLRSGNDDHTDLADPLLQALVAARIIIPIAASGNGALGDTYFPLAGRFRDPAPLPGWAGALITDVESLTQQDRGLVQTLARRLAAKPQ